MFVDLVWLHGGPFGSFIFQGDPRWCIVRPWWVRIEYLVNIQVPPRVPVVFPWSPDPKMYDHHWRNTTVIWCNPPEDCHNPLRLASVTCFHIYVTYGLQHCHLSFSMNGKAENYFSDYSNSTNQEIPLGSKDLLISLLPCKRVDSDWITTVVWKTRLDF